MTLLALCLLGQVSGALNGPKVTLSGSSSAYGELSHFITDSGPESEGELRWSLSPVVRVSGVPLGLDLLLSTRENPLRQALNKFRLSLGSRELLRTLLQRPDFGLVLPSLELGTSCPNYSELTLSGVPVNGLAFELEPWSGYLAGAVGRTQRAAVGSAYARMLYAGRLGVGKQTGSHCYLTLLHARDDSASIPPVFARPDSAVDSLEITKPQENYLAGLELGFVLLEGRLRLTGEVAGAEFTRDNRLPVVELKGVPAWAMKTLKPRSTSQLDWACRIQPELEVLDTRFRAALRMTGPGFRSLGRPSLRQDVLGYELGVSRSFFNGSLSCATAFSQERNDLLGMKRTTTTFTSGLLELGLTRPRLPSLRFGFRPSFQHDSIRPVQSYVFSASANHSFVSGSMVHSLGISISEVLSRISGTSAVVSQDLTLTHSVTFEFPLSLAASVNLGQTTHDSGRDQVFSAELAPSYSLTENWVTGLRLGWTRSANEQRTDIELSSGFPIWRLAQSQVSLARQGLAGSDAGWSENWRLSAGLSRNW